jgi:Amt family ammonium transporter
MLVEWIKTGKPTVLGAISGAVAGLVVITPASGFVTPMSAIIMGLIGGALCFVAATSLKHALGYDDSLDAFGVHGVGGTLGALLTGVFASGLVNPAIKDKFEGGAAQFGKQALAVIVTWIIAAVGTFILLKLVDAVVGLRCTENDEQEGLDISQHGERGYNLEESYATT